MPVSRETSARLAEVIAAVYERAEHRLLELIGKHLQAGHEAPDWAEAKLAELQVFRRRAKAIVAVANQEAVGQLVVILERAYLRGAAAATGELIDAGLSVQVPITQAERTVAAMVSALTGDLESLSLRIVRSAEDAYTAAVARALSGSTTGAFTRLQDAQHALDELASRGITAFIDTAGRRWSLVSYVEMATRTGLAQASVQGHLDRLEASGVPLVIVSDSSRECPRCAPWEGKVLARGPVPAIMGNALTGKSERVRVDGTLDQAIAAGLFHPNCTHSLSGFINGATIAGRATHDPVAYEAQVRQRAMERKVREWKRREAVSLTPEARRKAQAKVRQWQGSIRTHVARHDLPRKRNRESLTAAR